MESAVPAILIPHIDALLTVAVGLLIRWIEKLSMRKQWNAERTKILSATNGRA